MMTLQERLSEIRRRLLFDGATGTELNRRGVDTSLPLWSTNALLTAPDVLRRVHADYVAAGAEVITANTFRTHARNLRDAGIADRAVELTHLAVEVARDAVGSNAWVVGSQAPLEDCYSPDLVPSDDELRREHEQMSASLLDAGVDGILVETLNTIREAVAATCAAAATGLPVFTSFVCNPEARLLSGESIAAAVEAVLPFGPTALMVNCVPADQAVSMLRQLLAAANGLPCGIYANVGRPDAVQGWVNTDAIDPIKYAHYAAAWLDVGAAIIGGCCGTTPAHTREMARLNV